MLDNVDFGGVPLRPKLNGSMVDFGMVKCVGQYTSPMDTTVAGRNPATPGMCKTLWVIYEYQLVQDFFLQQ